MHSCLSHSFSSALTFVLLVKLVFGCFFPTCCNRGPPWCTSDFFPWFMKWIVLPNVCYNICDFRIPNKNNYYKFCDINRLLFMLLYVSLTSLRLSVNFSEKRKTNCVCLITECSWLIRHWRKIVPFLRLRWPPVEFPTRHFSNRITKTAWCIINFNTNPIIVFYNKLFIMSLKVSWLGSSHWQRWVLKLKILYEWKW